MAKKKRSEQSGPKQLDLDQAQLEQLLQRVEAGTLQPGDAAIIRTLIESLVMLSQAVDAKAATIRKILRLLFGASTEKKETVLPKKDKPPADSGKKKNKGHGRKGHKEYTAAKQIDVKHPELETNSPCPECKDGSLYPLESSVIIRIKGASPLFGTAYVLERFRCNLCGKVFTAPLPPEAGEHKYDSSAAAMIGLMKYGCGMPFHRLEGLQENLGNPLPSSTQWDVIESHTPQLVPVYNELIRQAAQGKVLHNDDTTAKILTLIKENKRDKPKRKGMFTTGLVSRCRDNTIALFFTGRNHAGENMANVLDQRTVDKEAPIQMCDALDRNVPQQHITLLTLCLVHARRNFVDAVQHFPEVCSAVIETLAEVYRVDAEAKARQMDPEQRLRHHQEQSCPLMTRLYDYLEEQFAAKRVEHNSTTGQAITYMLNNWRALTAFMRTANVPLDNNICERALKMAILHRKNSLFFKSEHGARTADIYMSLIYTCEQAGVNSFDYLVALMENAERVQADPAAWLPWNYTTALTAMAA